MKDIVLHLLVLICSFFLLASGAYEYVYAADICKQGLTTHERYGDNIVYFNFSEIPTGELSGEEIELPVDLKKRLADFDPPIEDCRQFERNFWEEAGKLHYTAAGLGSMNIKEAIMATVEVVVSRFSYYYVDTDKAFIAKYGKSLPTDRYFRLGMGDCDKYRNALIAAFKIVKILNPRLKNTYISVQYLGGNTQLHAWNSIIILDDDRLILSHIDPQGYDTDDILETGHPYITLAYDFYKFIFFEEIGMYSGYAPAFRIGKDILAKAADKDLQERVLREMALIVHLMSIKNKGGSVSRIDWIMDQYRKRGLRKHMDTLLYYAYRIYSSAGKATEAELFKRELFEKYPYSYWIEILHD